MAALGGYEGEAKRRNAQKIMDASWMRDPATKPVHVKWVDSGLPVIDDDDVPVYAKYNVKSYHNITGDSIAYLLEFRLEDMKENPNIRVGSYVQIMNEMDEPEWWLIVHYDDRTQFRQFSILKCTWIYKWVSKVNGKRIVYNCLGAPRKQNSYNSGVWLDYTTQTVENQEVMWLPTNDDTKTIQYDTKFLKSSHGRYPALKWTITKIEDSAIDGISQFTMAQTQFDPAKDNVDLMIADYWESAVTPELSELEENPIIPELEIAYSGKPTVRAGGSYKKLSLQTRVDGKLFDLDDDEINKVKWQIKWNIDPDENVDLEDIIDKLEYMNSDGKSIKINEYPCTIDIYPLKVKCNDYYLIGKTFTVTATSGNSSASIIMEVTSL
jgi:hypothetical protein